MGPQRILSRQLEKCSSRQATLGMAPPLTVDHSRGAQMRPETKLDFPNSAFAVAFATDADTAALYHFDEGSGDVIGDS